MGSGGTSAHGTSEHGTSEHSLTASVELMASRLHLLGVLALIMVGLGGVWLADLVEAAPVSARPHHVTVSFWGGGIPVRATTAARR